MKRNQFTEGSFSYKWNHLCLKQTKECHSWKKISLELNNFWSHPHPKPDCIKHDKVSMYGLVSWLQRWTQDSIFIFTQLTVTIFLARFEKKANASWKAPLHQISTRGSRQTPGTMPCRAPRCAQLSTSTSHWPHLTSWQTDGGRARREAGISHSQQTWTEVGPAVQPQTALAMFVLYERP